MLKNCYYDDRTLAFSTNDLSRGRNLFTVIVGRNGTGKSRLLRAIIENFVDVRESISRQRPIEYFERRPTSFHLECDSHPQSIIALSTSPFDRFPIARETQHVKGYEYLGLRGLGSQNLSLSFMARTLGALMRAVSENKDQARTVAQVLAYLGYEDLIEARLVPEIGVSSLVNILDSENPIEELDSLKRRRVSPFIDKIFYALHEGALSPQKVIDALKHWQETKRKPRLDVLINSNGVFNLRSGEEIDELTLFLFEIGFFRLRDVGLQKLSIPGKIRISEASSGEQCVVMALLGIASHIQDGALICIDEPEICLHPEWQERYIELLMTTFGQFSHCHFVIATHSPQVVAKLDDENCFVLDLESGNTFTGRELSNRSADFQLANVFRAPGYKNEYLSRELFNALGIIGSGGKLGHDQLKVLDKILALKDLLERSDPVRNLMELLEASLNEMGEASLNEMGVV